MKCVIYARVSTKREEQKNSLKNQISLGKRIANENGFTLVGNYIDNGISGTGFKNRSEINRLLQDAKKRKFDVMIAKSVSRLGRNTSKSLRLADELEQIGVRLILPEDDYDTSTSKSRFMFNLKAMLAEEESAKLSERTKLGQRERARRGNYKGSLPPYGYKIEQTTLQLILDDNTAPIVKEIFRLYLHEGLGLFTISNTLMRRKIATPRTISKASNAGTKWHQSTLKRILTNPVYTGKLVYCREETTNILSKSETYKIRKKVDPKNQIIIENAHPAIIREEDFQAVQILMKKKGKDKSNGKESLFAHITRCADCGSGMHFKPDRRKGAYVCGGYVKYTTSYCSSHIISESKLLELIKSDLKAMIKNNVKVERLYGIAEKKVTSLQSSLAKKIKTVEREIDKLNNQFNSLLTLHSEGALTTEQFKQQNERIAHQLKELSNQKIEMTVMKESKKDTTEQLQAFKREIDGIAKLDIDDEKILKQILHRIISSIEIFEGEKIKIHYNLSPL